MNQINLTINNQQITCNSNMTILQAAATVGIEIPTLCYLKDLIPEASCRICVVEVNQDVNLRPACATMVSEGMVVYTHSPRVINARQHILDLILSTHKIDCLRCKKSGFCQLQKLAQEYAMDSPSVLGADFYTPIDHSNVFFDFDKDKCILCRKCVRTCQELQCTYAIGLQFRGPDTGVGPAFSLPLGESSCVSCGNCVSNCPTGALMPKFAPYYDLAQAQLTKTICPYCGVGCEIMIASANGKILGIQPADGQANHGLLCVKGKFAHKFINSDARLKVPLIKVNGVFTECSWEQAYQTIINKIQTTKELYGADALAGLSSARCTNEENYLFQKLFRAVIGTNNVDHCARLCHASTVAGLATSFGSGAMTNSIDEIDGMDLIFIIGSNTTETHPVIAAKMKQAILKGHTKLLVAEPRKIEMAEHADLFVQIKPGTNVALLNGMISYIIDNKLYDEQFINTRTENFAQLVHAVADFTPEMAAEICGCSANDVKRAAELYATAKNAGIYYAMGITQHSTGTEGVMSVANLAMLCGQVGKKSSGVNPLRGQNNVQGACDMGALPTDYPGYQKVFLPENKQKFEQAWGTELSGTPGIVATEMFHNVLEDKLHFMYIMGENPVVSEPDSNHIKKALTQIDFLVVQDIFLTETAQFADIVLPATSFAEKDGTFTNTERRVQRVRKAIPPIGSTREDYRILNDLMNGLGYQQVYHNAAEIMEEIATVTPSYGGISFARLEHSGLQWPCFNKEHPGTGYLHQGVFSRGRGLFMPIQYHPSNELPDAEYPFVLTTGRILYQYHTRTMTGQVDELTALVGHNFLEINPLDASKLGVVNGEQIKVSSRRGSIVTNVKITDIIAAGITFMPFHFGESAANVLTNPVLDPIAKIPELKVCAIKIEKL